MLPADPPTFGWSRSAPDGLWAGPAARGDTAVHRDGSIVLVLAVGRYLDDNGAVRRDLNKVLHPVMTLLVT
jgi:hypothetical protein